MSNCFKNYSQAIFQLWIVRLQKIQTIIIRNTVLVLYLVPRGDESSYYHAHAIRGQIYLGQEENWIVSSEPKFCFFRQRQRCKSVGITQEYKSSDIIY
jgi:hypothetical protein